MSDVEIWLVVAGLTLVTILMRSSFLMLGDYLPLPARVQHGLRYAPVCALVALVTPELFLTQGAFDFSI
ncbi:MAG TPA: AzlD domain-containing protein, partial [Burkholderiaceae bacterium]|nr:AzlD domain-containing protein [Burkholderiaceae bacterium]